MIAARIDHLSPQGRDLIRKASVFARSSFTLDELDLVAEPNAEALGQLEEEELLEHDGDRPELWRFSHGMVRDVAYESLPSASASACTCWWPTGSGNPETAARRPRAIAFHLEQAASRRSTSTRATVRSPNARSTRWPTPATSRARART